VFLFIGGNLVLNQQISIGEFLMMYQYMAYFSDPITTFFRMFMPTGSQYIGSGVFSGVFVYRRKFSFESTDFDWRISDDVSIYGVFL
ncbi:hypothetical protein, partial [Roseburia inulinivorans]|uniref:hypothetical protein n=1 Tax=Roseburia inulinivorans TaxID=360807 RepID=UPI001C25CDFF